MKQTNPLLLGASTDREAWATRAIFFAAGLVSSSWAAIIPTVKANIMVNDGTLGLLLLCSGIGALIAMPFAGQLTTRFGCRAVLIFSVSCFSIILPALAIIPTVFLMAISLSLFGVAIGMTSCAINVQAVIVEKKASKPLMSGFHGFFSLGAITGAASVTSLMSFGMLSITACFIVSLIVFSLLAISYYGLLTYANPPVGSPFSIPRGPVLLIGFICFSLFLAEGTIFDWSGVYLNEYRDFPHARAGIGLVCFSMTMTIGRLTGDYIITQLGARKVVTWGGIIATAGFFITLSTDVLPILLTGYSLIGIGCSNIVPVMFSATGQQTYMPQAKAVPAVATFGYFGSLAGPASVGFIALYFTLPAALYGIAILVALATVISRKVDM